MHADWVQLMQDYSDTEGVLIASADCNTQSRTDGSGAELCNHYNLPYYPYLIYGTPDNHQEYQGGRSHAELLAFAQANLGPSPSPTPTPTPSPSPAPGCVDVSSASDCSYWYGQGYCYSSSQYYTYMRQNCCHTCGFGGAVDAAMEVDAPATVGDIVL